VVEYSLNAWIERD